MPFINSFSEQRESYCRELPINPPNYDMQHRISMSVHNPSMQTHGQNHARQPPALQTAPPAPATQDPTVDTLGRIDCKADSPQRSSSHHAEHPRPRKRKADGPPAVPTSATFRPDPRPPALRRSATVRWTRDEHARFLEGLERFGVGQWCSIARHCVPSRSPAQVASHHQKFAIRSNLPQERRHKASLLDSTTPTVQTLVAQAPPGARPTPPAPAPPTPPSRS
jgi:SHAQKYF class myb-like DNA-binding protein